MRSLLAEQKTAYSENPTSCKLINIGGNDM
jgi:hypothetical protein